MLPLLKLPFLVNITFLSGISHVDSFLFFEKSLAIGLLVVLPQEISTKTLHEKLHRAFKLKHRIHIIITL